MKGDVGALRRLDSADRRAARVQNRLARKVQRAQARRRADEPGAQEPEGRSVASLSVVGRSDATHAAHAPLGDGLATALARVAPSAHRFRRRLARGAFVVSEVGRHGAGIVAAPSAPPPPQPTQRALLDAVACMRKTQVPAPEGVSVLAPRFALLHAHGRVACECEIATVDGVPLFLVAETDLPLAHARAPPHALDRALVDRVARQAAKMLGRKIE
jgi:hypothetical protein